MSTPLPRTKSRVYVKVSSDFDSTGYMCPRCITWIDGRQFKIDEVKDFRPASCLGSSAGGSCYTVVIHGVEKHLFFEKSDNMFPSRFGRWFVECPNEPQEQPQGGKRYE